MYDHRSHAGNQGDVVKHVGLMAALRIVLEEAPHDVRYVDAFAGPGGSTLIPGGEWTRGVGSVNRNQPVRSTDVQAWLRWYLARPVLMGCRYPGSALIATDLAAMTNKRVAMTLWDTSKQVVDELRVLFPKHRVVHSPVDPASRCVAESDFLFVDPPGIASKSKPTFPEWQLLLRLMAGGSHMVAWLPVNVAIVEGSPRVSGASEAQLLDALKIQRTAATRVLWANGGRTIGCHLIYRTSHAAVTALRQAVEEVVSLCSWRRKEIRHYDACENAG